MGPKNANVREQAEKGWHFQNTSNFQINPKNFHHRLVTQDETWFHHFEPDSKIQSKQEKNSSSPRPKKFKQETAYVGKVMASVFWDSSGIIIIDYLEKGKLLMDNTMHQN